MRDTRSRQEPSRAKAAAPANPGRLGVLSELAALLGEDAESAENLQRVVDGARRATAADAVQLVLADVADTGAAGYASGAVDGDPGPRHVAKVRAGGHDLGALTLRRVAGREAFAEADTLFAGTLAGHVASALDAARLRRVEAEAAPERRRFAQALSREMRSPLTTLRGFLDVLGRGQLTEDQRTFVDFAERNSRQLQDLTDELVLLTRLETEKPAADLLDVSDVARRCLRASELRGTVTVERDLVARCDAARLVVALDALLENARLYGPGGGAVAISLHREGSWIEVSVDDAGPGVGEDERERIFERFARGRAATANAIPGHGLGLAVVGAAARSAGGRAWCETAPGGGARFCFTLPAG